jgi:NhaA family Na+:H+ antiporter
MKEQPIDVFLKPINSFIKSETTAGILLFLSTVIALIWANSVYSQSYHHIWQEKLSIEIAGYSISNSLHHWINDGLMAMFFFVVGLELKREVIGGDLSSPRHAILPLAAALGGMVVPALIFVWINKHSDGINGWGIPMATDIAFALGILSLLGRRVPVALKVFLTALAIADDLGAVLVIAFFYTSEISASSLLWGTAFLAVLITANAMGVRSVIFYGIIGIGGLWLAFLMSGIHATIAGVLAAIAIPARTKIDEKKFAQNLKDYTAEFGAIPPNNISILEPEQMRVIQKIKSLTLAADTPLQRLENGMHPIVALIVLPLFALSNAGIEFTSDFFRSLVNPLSLGVIGGLFLGKFIGITVMCWIMTKLKLAELPKGVVWSHLIGVAFLGGIGFTMSIFITNLAFVDATLILLSKAGILVASLLAGLTGFVILRFASTA